MEGTHSLYSLLRSKLLSRALKIQLYHSVIQPVAMYGCETWSLTKMDEESLPRFERKILRIIFGPTQDMATNEYRIRTNLELRDLYQSPNIVQLIKSRRLRWAGHVIRSDHSRIIKSVWEKSPDGKRSRGGPRMRWQDNIQRDLESLGVQNMETAAQDRTVWRRIVREVKTHEGL